jgi:hypothetical protein
VEATRSATVNVATDSNALLTLDETVGANSAYAKQDGSGKLHVEIDQTSDVYDGANGVNSDAETRLLNVFGIKNQGTQPVAVYVPPESVLPASVGAADGDYSGFYIDLQFTNRPNGGYDGGEISGTVTYYQSGGESNFTDAASRAFEGEGGAANYVLDPGQRMNGGFYIDAADNSFSENIEFDIRADADLVPDWYSQ